MVKHFLISPDANPLSKEEILEIEKGSTELSSTIWKHREEKAKKAVVEEKCNLVHTFGRVIIRVDLQKKNQTTFADGTTIRLERQFNEFNRRITEPVQGTVMSAEYIPKNCEILISHNALHDTNKIFSYKTSSPDIQYFSIPEYECFAWLDKDGTPQPMKNFEFGLRVFKPYEGRISFISPEIIKDVMYITTGKLKGKVVHTVKAADYQIVYQGQDGKEKNIIRIRHSEDENFDREEIQAVSDHLTEQVKKSKLKIGLSKSDCKTLKEYKSFHEKQ